MSDIYSNIITLELFQKLTLKTAFFVFFLFKSSSEDMFIDFKGQEEGKRGKNIDVRKKHQSVASCMSPDQAGTEWAT